MTNGQELQLGKRKELKLLFGKSPNAIILTKDDVVQESLVMEQTLCDENNLKFGKCSSRVFKITIFNNNSTTYKGMPLLPTIDIWDDVNGWVDRTLFLGRYIVHEEKLSADRMTKELVCYDEIFEYNTKDVSEWYHSLTFPISFKAFKDSFFTYMGTFADKEDTPLDNVMIAKTIEDQGISALLILQSICELQGCFGQTGNNGGIHFVYLNNNVQAAFTQDDYTLGGLTYSDYVTEEISNIILRNDMETLGYAYPEEIGDNPYYVIGNVLAMGISQSDLENTVIPNIYNKVKDIYNYVPMTLNTWCDINLDVGDKITIETMDSTTISSYILKRTMKGINALFDDYSCDVESNFTSQVSLGANEVEKLKTKIANGVKIKGDFIVEDGDGNVVFEAIADEHKVQIGDFEVDSSGLSSYYPVENPTVSMILNGDSISHKSITEDDTKQTDNEVTMTSGQLFFSRNNTPKDGSTSSGTKYTADLNAYRIFFKDVSKPTVPMYSFLTNASLEFNTEYNDTLVSAESISTTGNATVGKTLHLTSTTDASASTPPSTIPLIIGSKTGVHLEFDNNEIMAKSDGTTTNTLFLNHDGGNVQVGSTTNSSTQRLVIQNSNGTMYGLVNSDGDMGLYDATNGKYIIRKAATDGTVTVDGKEIKASAGYNVTVGGNLSSGSDSYIPTTLAVVEYLRSHLKSGRTSEITVGGSASTSATSVSFGTAFGSTPRIELTLENTGTWGYGLGSIEAFVTSVSASGFSYRIANNNSTERKVRVHWVATDMGNN